LRDRRAASSLLLVEIVSARDKHGAPRGATQWPRRGRPAARRARRNIDCHLLPGGTLSARRRFDRAYYDRWYRHSRHRIATPAEIRRRAVLALGVAEWILGRAVRHVLDVGCGEALWRAPLVALRPRLSYQGVDSSPYVVRRFGRRRGIQQGSFGELADLPLRDAYDLIICADMLHYVNARELGAGLAGLAARLGGVAYLPVVTSADDVDGDVHRLLRRSPAWHRARFRDAGLVPLGLECYVRRDALSGLTALERWRA
jgi:SAM-dependent methyltransferase